MSRIFTQSNGQQFLGLGVDGVGNLIQGQSAISWHGWLWLNSAVGSAENGNRILSAYVGGGNSSNVICNISKSGGTSGQLRVGARSQSADSFQKQFSTSVIPSGEWSSIGFVLDYANDRIKIYVGGVLETDAAAAFGSASYTHSSASLEDSYSDQVNVSTSTLRLDGHFGEGAFFAGDIGDANFTALAGGAPADTISGFTLLSYIPVDGTSDPEPDFGTPGLTTTLYGAPAQGLDPPVTNAIAIDSLVQAQSLGAVTVTGGTSVVVPADIIQLQTLDSVSLIPEILSDGERENIDLGSSSIANGDTATPTITLVPYGQLNETNATVNPEWWFWAGRLTQMNGKTPVFKVPNTYYYQTQPPSSYRPVYSEDDGVTWTAFDSFTSNDGSGNWEFSNGAAFSASVVRVAYARPYTVSDVAAYIASISGNQYVSELPSTTGFVYGTTTSANYTAPAGGNIPAQNLYGFMISDPGTQPDDGLGKRNAVLSAGVHPAEDIGNEMLEAACNFLLSADAAAVRLRKNFNWHIYPMVNAPGRTGGNVRGTFETGTCGGDPRDQMDPNRHLGDGCLEVNAKWLAAFVADTGGRVNLYLDYHGFVSPKFDHWYNDQIPGSVDYHAALQTYIPTIGGNTSSIPTNNRNYIHNTYGAKVSDTLEMGFHTNPSDADTVTLGEASLKAVDDLFTAGVFDPLAVNGVLQAQSLGAAAVTPATSSVTPDDSQQAQTVAAASLTEHASIAPADSPQGQTIGQSGLTEHASLPVDPLDQVQTIDGVILTAAGTVSPDQLMQLQALGGVVLTEHNTLAVDALTQGQSVDTITLTIAGTIAVDPLEQGQSLEVVALTEHAVLAPAGLNQAQALDMVTVTAAAGPSLVVASLSQAQQLGAAGLTQHGILVVDDVVQQQILGGVTFGGVVGWMDGKVVLVSAIGGVVKINGI